MRDIFEDKSPIFRGGYVALSLIPIAYIIAIFVDFTPFAWQWMRENQDMAGWVQAIGTIFALFVAIAVAYLQHALTTASKNRQELKRNQAIGIAIFPALMELREKVNTELDHIESDEWETLFLGSPVLQKIVVPEEMLQYVHDYPYLDSGGHDLLQLISFLQQYNRMIDKQHDVKVFDADSVKNHLVLSRALINDVDDALTAIHP